MRLLFEMDKRDYHLCTHSFVRNSARSIIIRGKQVAMIHSLKYDYYKFPGGGIEKNEDPVAAMVRETQEEAGLIVLPESIKEYGYVHRIQRSDRDETECFIQDNYYYLCDVEDNAVPQRLDGYEAAEGFVLQYIEPSIAIEKNRRAKEGAHHQSMLERDARVLELLMEENIL